MDIEKYIVAATGLGYLVVGLAQYFKGSPSNALIWLGYAAAQVGLLLAQVASVGIKVRVFPGDEVEMVEKFIARREVQRQRNHLCMTGGA